MLYGYTIVQAGYYYDIHLKKWEVYFSPKRPTILLDNLLIADISKCWEVSQNHSNDKLDPYRYFAVIHTSFLAISKPQDNDHSNPFLSNIPMYPTIDLGFFQLNTYWTIYSIAIIIGAMLVFHRIYQAGFPVEHITNGSLLTIVGGTLGSFLFRGGAVTIQHIFSTGDLTWIGGSSVIGMLLGGIITASIYILKHGFPLGQIFDLGIVPIPLGQAIGRLGCLAAGCCYGKPTFSWIGILLPDNEGILATRYPTQLMSSVINFGIFLVLILFETYQKKNNKESWPSSGFIFLLYIELFSIHRFAIEFLRGDTIPFWGSFSMGHTITLTVFLLNSAIMFWTIYSTKKPQGV